MDVDIDEYEEEWCKGFVRYFKVMRLLKMAEVELPSAKSKRLSKYFSSSSISGNSICKSEKSWEIPLKTFESKNWVSWNLTFGDLNVKLHSESYKPYMQLP